MKCGPSNRTSGPELGHLFLLVAGSAVRAALAQLDRFPFAGKGGLPAPSNADLCEPDRVPFARKGGADDPTGDHFDHGVLTIA